MYWNCILYLLTAVLANWVGLCSGVPWCSGHGVDGAQLGVRQDDTAGSDCRTREHLPAAVTDYAGELEQEFRSAHHRPQHTVSAYQSNIVVVGTQVV